MFPNRFTDERFGTVGEMNNFHRWFLFETWERNFHKDHNRYLALKLVSDHYLATRKIIKGFTDLHDLLAYINSHQLQILNVPLVMGDHLRNPQAFQSIEIEDLIEADLNYTVAHFGDWEERIEGPGWEGVMRINIPYRTLRYDDRSVVNALASYGIYISELSYGNDDKGRYLDCKSMMLKAHFNLQIDVNVWRNPDYDPDDLDEDDDDDDDLRRARDRISDIEDGYLDDEDPRI